MITPAFQELMDIRAKGFPDELEVNITGQDPVFSTQFKIGETCASILAAIGVAVTDIWELGANRRQTIEIDIRHAAAALRSHAYQYMKQDDHTYAFVDYNPELTKRRLITRPYPTLDGRWFLPHSALQHLFDRVLQVLQCEPSEDSVRSTIAKWNALDLEDAIAKAKGCGAMVRSSEEWLAHPQGKTLALKPVVEIIKIGESDPEPFSIGDRPLSGIRVLDLTRILAGPICGKTMAEHGADVLMITAQHLPQNQNYVMDTSHGKRNCFLDLTKPDELQQLKSLIKDADVFTQGYRPGVLKTHGFAPKQVAELRPGIIYTSISCYGHDGPFQDRAGWEQIAQTVTGIAHENGTNQPQILPAPACDYSTGYLAAYGNLLALAKRAKEGGSYHVRVSLCQTGMFINRQGRVNFSDPEMGLSEEELSTIQIKTETPYGSIKHLGPVLQLSETPPHWSLPTVPLGSHSAEWLG